MYTFGILYLFASSTRFREQIVLILYVCLHFLSNSRRKFLSNSFSILRRFTFFSNSSGLFVGRPRFRAPINVGLLLVEVRTTIVLYICLHSTFYSMNGQTLLFVVSLQLFALYSPNNVFVPFCFPYKNLL